MVRKYRLEDWDADDRALNDPNASWRSDPATIRQIQRLRFFKVKTRKGMTKGDCADLLDSLEPTIEQLEDYEAWKTAGHPNIEQWHAGRKRGWFQPSEWPTDQKREGNSRFGCLSFFIALVLLSIGVTVTSSLIHGVDTAPMISSSSTPTPSVSPKSATPSLLVSKPVLNAGGKARLVVDASLKIQYGFLGIHAGAVVRVISINGTNITIEYQGQTGVLDADKLTPE